MEIIHTDNSSQAIGPYSQAIRVEGWVYTSGVVGMRPDNSVAGDTIAEQTHQVFANLQAILGAAGCTLQDVVKATVYLADMDEFSAMNEIYSQYMDGHQPARSCVEVARLPRDLRVEIDVIARPAS
ncbi:MAG: RidA family protein [Planctomycetota bacterium]|jgi:2-iminobutanoate/2-iminopropanoate deaminase|nr:RidA family protein [Planctomycetota bacterium]